MVTLGTRMIRDVAAAAADSIGRRLQTGERLLWEGQPDVARYVRDAGARAALILLPVSYLAAWEWTRFFGTSGPTPHALVVFFGALRWLATAGIYVYALRLALRRARATAEITRYALTSRRVIVLRPALTSLSEAKTRIDDIALFRTQPSLRLSSDRIGTIGFGRRFFDYGLAFRAIDGASDVFHKLVEARSAQPETAALTASSYAGGAARSVPKLDIAEHLWGGEQVLWQGKPNRREYLRVVLASDCGIGIFAAFAGCVGLLHWHVFTWLHAALIGVLGGIAADPIVRRFYEKHYDGLCYFVTSERVIAAKSGLRSIAHLDEKPLAQTRGAHITRIKRGTGTLVFEKAQKTKTTVLGTSSEMFIFSFENLDRWAEVLATVRKAREDLKVSGTQAELEPLT